MTPSGVRDGDPAALASLCDRRGPAVLAYTHQVAGDAAAVVAAAEAFAEFRAAVHAAQDPASINPEALLVNATRHAAARHAGIVATGVCAEVPGLLAARADRTITLADLDRLDEHLETCWTCRAPVARFEAAERAYRDPPATPVAPEAAGVIVAAMTAVAPVRADEPPPPPPSEPVAAPLTAAGSNGNGRLAPGPEPEPAPSPAAAATPKSRALPRRAKRGAPPAQGGLRPAVVLPIVLVALALVIALFVSGVFGADDPTPSSSTASPPVAAPPAPRTTPEVVEVPGADDASADAVERAKARARREQTTRTTTAPAAATPPRAAASAPASTPPAGATASKPKPAAKPQSDTGGTDSSTAIDANNGATGAEQLPPAADTSTVPELAPPPEPAVPTPPG